MELFLVGNYSKSSRVFPTKLRGSFIIQNISVDGTYNFRAVTAPNGAVLFYRSASLDKLSANGEATLLELGVERVIDLRSPAEQGPRSHSFDTVNIPLFGENVRPPTAGSLISIYQYFIKNSGSFIARAVDELGANPGRVLVHCRVGKDRTGVVAALASLAAGIDYDRVLEDYGHSGLEVSWFHGDQARSELTPLALTDEELRSSLEMHLESPRDIMAEILEMVDREYGGAVRYLEQHGVAEKTFDVLRGQAV